MEVVEVAEHQRRFEAAVRAVKSLPNDGSYKPSHELMLKFYGFYKQATQGPCKIGRPGFWDPVGRYKWDAWNSLGEMSKVEAMIAYVDEMKKVGGQILESMPVTDKVEELLHLLGPFYEVVCDMPRPPGFPTSQAAGIKRTSCILHLTACIRLLLNYFKATYGGIDSDSEVFCDSVEQIMLEEAWESGRRATPREGARGHHSGGTGAGGGDGEDVGESRRHRTDVSEQIAATLVRLQQDMQSVLQRLSTLEALAATQVRPSNHSGWPFEMSAPALIFFMVWPFVAQWLVHVLRRRRKIKKAGAFLSLH
ncbi:unnamed protein product [Lampetra fluviatilis]